MPWVSPNLKTLRAGVRAGGVASRAIASVLETGARLAGHLDSKGARAIGDIPKVERNSLIAAIEESVPNLQGAKAELMLAQTLLFSVPRGRVAEPITRELAAFDNRVKEVIQILEEGIPFLEVAPHLLGYPAAKQYLLLLQNSDEMRPSGGFIGTYGFLTLEAGHITQFMTDDVYNLDRFSPASKRPLAPKPLTRYLDQSRWYLRDANWSPDFPMSAKQVLRFYDEELIYGGKASGHPEALPPYIDGVIAIMPRAIAPLLGIVGPITVEGQKFTAENFTDALEYEVEVKFDEKGIPRTQRKEIVSELGGALIEKLFALPVSSSP